LIRINAKERNRAEACDPETSKAKRMAGGTAWGKAWVALAAAWLLLELFRARRATNHAVNV
jgi:hypothetical protein